MSEVEFSIDVDPLISELSRRVSNLRPVMKEIAELIKLKIEDEFESEGRGRWPDLTEATIKRHNRTGAAKLLQDTGVLVGSITADADSMVAEAFVTNVPYAKYHVTGTKFMPKRDFLDVDREALAEEASDMILRELIP